MLDVEKLSIDMNYCCTKMYSDSDSKQQQGSYQFGLNRFQLKLQHHVGFGLKTISHSYSNLDTRMYSDSANIGFIL